MRKIIFVTTVPDSLGFFKGQLNFLRKYFEVLVASSETPLLKRVAEEEGVKYFAIPMKREISLLYDIRALFHFIFLLRKIKPDIVHGNTPKGALLSVLAAYFVRTPERIYMCHGLRYQGCQGAMRKLLLFMERLTCKCATKVICVSEGVLKTLIKDRVCESKKLKIVLYGSANGIDVDYFDRTKIQLSQDFYSRYTIKAHDFIFCFIGRIVRDKGINELVQAFSILNKEFRNLKLILIGRREDEINPISKTSDQIIEQNANILLLGAHKDVRPFLYISDTLVLPSYREGFGQVLMEAGAMGVPCIASNIIGCNNVIIEGINGIFCKPRDVDSLLSAMRVMYVDNNLKNSLKKKCRDSIIMRFDQNKVWSAYLKEYQSL